MANHAPRHSELIKSLVNVKQHMRRTQSGGMTTVQAHTMTVDKTALTAAIAKHMAGAEGHDEKQLHAMIDHAVKTHHEAGRVKHLRFEGGKWRSSNTKPQPNDHPQLHVGGGKVKVSIGGKVVHEQPMQAPKDAPEVGEDGKTAEQAAAEYNEKYKDSPANKEARESGGTFEQAKAAREAFKAKAAKPKISDVRQKRIDEAKAVDHKEVKQLDDEDFVREYHRSWNRLGAEKDRLDGNDVHPAIGKAHDKLADEAERRGIYTSMSRGNTHNIYTKQLGGGKEREVARHADGVEPHKGYHVTTEQNKAEQAKHEQLEAIAKQHMGVETLKSRGSDSLDFHDKGVGEIKQALMAAHAHGAGGAHPSAEADAELIAKNHLNIPTLKSRGSDSLDFHDVGVSSLKMALQAAHEAGKNAKDDKPAPSRKQAPKENARNQALDKLQKMTDPEFIAAYHQSWNNVDSLKDANRTNMPKTSAEGMKQYDTIHGAHDMIMKEAERRGLQTVESGGHYHYEKNGVRVASHEKGKPALSKPSDAVKPESSAPKSGGQAGPFNPVEANGAKSQDGSHITVADHGNGKFTTRRVAKDGYTTHEARNVDHQGAHQFIRQHLDKYAHDRLTESATSGDKEKRAAAGKQLMSDLKQKVADLRGKGHNPDEIKRHLYNYLVDEHENERGHNDGHRMDQAVRAKFALTEGGHKFHDAIGLPEGKTEQGAKNSHIENLVPKEQGTPSKPSPADHAKALLKAQRRAIAEAGANAPKHDYGANQKKLTEAMNTKSRMAAEEKAKAAHQLHDFGNTPAGHHTAASLEVKRANESHSPTAMAIAHHVSAIATHEGRRDRMAHRLHDKNLKTHGIEVDRSGDQVVYKQGKKTLLTVPHHEVVGQKPEAVIPPTAPGSDRANLAKSLIADHQRALTGSDVKAIATATEALRKASVGVHAAEGRFVYTDHLTNEPLGAFKPAAPVTLTKSLAEVAKRVRDHGGAADSTPAALRGGYESGPEALRKAVEFAHGGFDSFVYYGGGKYHLTVDRAPSLKHHEGRGYVELKKGLAVPVTHIPDAEGQMVEIPFQAAHLGVQA